MARIRTIKPDFFQSLTVTQLSATARLTFIGLWTHVDDEGRCVDEPKLIAAALWPLDDNIGAATVETHLEDIERLGLIVRYQVDGRRFLQVSGWGEHQKISRPSESKHPGPESADIDPVDPDPEDSENTHGSLSEDSLPEGNGTGKGMEQGGAPEDAPDDPEQQFHDYFWPVYPPTNGVKRDKAAAKREFCKLGLEDRRKAVRGARNKADHYESTGEQPPYAERFLKHRVFEDFQVPVVSDRNGKFRPPAPEACPECQVAMSSHDDEACELVKAGKL